MFAAFLHRESIFYRQGADRKLMISEQLRHKGQALKIVRKLVADPQMPYLLDELCMAIMYLAMNERASMKAPLKDANPFKPPMNVGQAQWLDLYTGREVVAAHMKALKVVLEQHGGILKLTKYGIPWLISL